MHPRFARSPGTVTGWRHRLRNACAVLGRHDAGSSLVEFGLMIPFLGLLLLGIIDMGRAYYLSIEVNNAAYAGASYGTQNYTDTAGMVKAAEADEPDVGNANTPTAVYGCVCSQSTVSSAGVASCTTAPTCTGSGNFVVNYVTVTTSATYTPLFIHWITVGLPSSITLNGKATLRAGQ